MNLSDWLSNNPTKLCISEVFSLRRHLRTSASIQQSEPCCRKPRIVEKRKIYLSSHKMLWVYLSEHNAHFSGKQFIALSVWAISQPSTFLCTELSTEIGDPHMRAICTRIGKSTGQTSLKQWGKYFNTRALQASACAASQENTPARYPRESLRFQLFRNSVRTFS